MILRREEQKRTRDDAHKHNQTIEARKDEALLLHTFWVVKEKPKQGNDCQEYQNHEKRFIQSKTNTSLAIELDTDKENLAIAEKPLSKGDTYTGQNNDQAYTEHFPIIYLRPFLIFLIERCILAHYSGSCCNEGQDKCSSKRCH